MKASLREQRFSAAIVIGALLVICLAIAVAPTPVGHWLWSA